MTAREKQLFEEQARQLAEIQAVLEEQKIEEETKLEEKIITSIVLSLQICMKPCWPELRETA